MTPDKVIEWARDVGATMWTNGAACSFNFTPSQIARLIELARADKQEQCAKVCASRDMGDGSREDQEARRCESAIRALKD